MAEPGAKSRILLIDDDTSLLVTLRDFLQFEGYEVVTAASAEDGLAQLDEMTPDLIVLDMSMPGMGGMGFLQRISEEGQPQYPVLVLTARSQLAEYFGEVDVEGFVSKPCDPNDLLMEISRIVFLTRGKPSGEGLDGTGAVRSVLVGGDEEALSDICASLRDAGYAVHVVSGGPEVLERAILERPSAILMTAGLVSSEDGAVDRMLREMPNTSRIPALIVGAAEDAESGGDGEALRRHLVSTSVRDVRDALNALLDDA